MNMRMGAIKMIIDGFSEALSKAENITDPNDRAKAYMEAKVNLTPYTLEAIRDADRIAMEQEISRRISRS